MRVADLQHDAVVVALDRQVDVRLVELGPHQLKEKCLNGHGKFLCPQKLVILKRCHTFVYSQHKGS